MILVGVVPGAMASNVIAYLAKTDVAYSIALTSTATLLAPLLTPALTYLYAGTVIVCPKNPRPRIQPPQSWIGDWEYCLPRRR